MPLLPMNPGPAAATAQNPKPTFPRIYPMNPEPDVAPTPNSKSTFSRIYPVNPEPTANVDAFPQPELVRCTAPLLVKLASSVSAALSLQVPLMSSV